MLFWGESKNGFVISDHMNSSLPKRSEKESFTTTTAWPRAPSDEENRGETKKQTDPLGEAKKEKQH